MRVRDSKSMMQVSPLTCSEQTPERKKSSLYLNQFVCAPMLLPVRSSLCALLPMFLSPPVCICVIVCDSDRERDFAWRWMLSVYAFTSYRVALRTQTKQRTKTDR